MKMAEVCRKHGNSSATFFKWKRKYAAMTGLTHFSIQVLEPDTASYSRAAGFNG
jgi:transposase-like protein